MANDELITLKGICKEFPGVKALSNVSFSLRAGEIHGLVGENGAGKSTLMKILSGAYKKDSGTILVDGKETEMGSPQISEELGIAIIYQELNLFRNLSVAENIFLNRQPVKGGILDWRELNRKAQELFEQLGIHNIDVTQKVSRFSVAQQQLIEIAKAMSHNARVVIMDEPTSSLTQQETEILFRIMHRLKEQGNAVVFITHRLGELFAVTDRMTVLRDGQVIGTRNTADINKDELISMMIGRVLTQQFPTRVNRIGDVIFRVENLSDENGRVKNLSFNVRSGEVLGFNGLVGAGRTEAMRLIFGVDKKKSGKFYKSGKEIHINTPRDAISNRIGFVTEDRKSEGLFLPFSCRFNTTLVALRKIKKHGILNMKLDKQAADNYRDSLRIVTPSMDQRVGQLSGGNQQKVVLAKWLFSDADVVIMDEPTRGVDVGAKREIYEIINKLTAENKAVIVVSSEMEEVMGICDRIYVMCEGKISKELQRSEFSQELISKYSIGGYES